MGLNRSLFDKESIAEWTCIRAVFVVSTIPMTHGRKIRFLSPNYSSMFGRLKMKGNSDTIRPAVELVAHKPGGKFAKLPPMTSGIVTTIIWHPIARKRENPPSSLRANQAPSSHTQERNAMVNNWTAEQIRYVRN
jgi:hypothetical protein